MRVSRRWSNPTILLPHIPIKKGTMGGTPDWQGAWQIKGGIDLNGFFNQDGLEVVIWIVLIIFLLSIFFDEGID
ncbi:hypothetical protein [Brevibacillus choshinensis]|uniref:hypothetical protein n=1 Tax=Brevibacillus choshinensis TaxID=54911 RepID=UPI002E1F5330|nr:hypothetical protein [Brevibacillus choshinensis]MED4753129.1 hypothetical protein [Brevibacillus choshinensis]MED4781292.1 hypothetical protein [Brevibacillus choshinensis]